ncbi:hypothetical protein [Micromonospora sp. NPDC005173]
MLLFDGSSAFAVVILDLTSGGGQVCGICAVINPDKLPTSTEH